MSHNTLRDSFHKDKDSAQLIDDTELIDLDVLWQSMKRNWSILVTCIVVAMVIAIALWKVMPAQWQASAILQIGQMPAGAPTLIEPPAQVAERLTQRETEDKVLTAVALPLDEETNKYTRLFRKSLKASVVKNTNFIQISVAAYSPQDATRYLHTSAQFLIELHNQRMTPVIENLKTRIATNERQMTEAKAKRDHLEITLTSSGVAKNETPFAPSIVAINLLSEVEGQIRALTAEHAALADLMTPTETYPTSLIDAPFVPEKPFFPKLSLFLAAGLLIGAIVGVLLARHCDNKREKVPT